VSENSSDHHIVLLLQKAVCNAQKGVIVIHEQKGNRVHLVRAKVKAMRLGTIIILHAFTRPVYP
jgi:hypothetical protein